MNASKDGQKQRDASLKARVLGESGAEENRTPDLIIANDALYQLSYRPEMSTEDRSPGLGV